MRGPLKVIGIGLGVAALCALIVLVFGDPKFAAVTVVLASLHIFVVAPLIAAIVYFIVEDSARGETRPSERLPGKNYVSESAEFKLIVFFVILELAGLAAILLTALSASWGESA